MHFSGRGSRTLFNILAQMNLFQTEFNSFQGLNIAKKKLYSVCQRCSSANLCYGIYQKVTLFGRSRNLRRLINRTLIEADPGPLPTGQMELFVTIVYGSKTCIKVLSQGDPSQMLALVLDLLLITMAFRKILRQLQACILYFRFIQPVITLK